MDKLSILGYEFPTTLAETVRWLLYLLSTLLAIKIVITAIYNVYYHPLRHFPGPWLAKATPLPFAWRLINGRMVHWTTSLHLKYGDAVRIQPDELSFTAPDAFNAIFQSRPQLPKPVEGTIVSPNGVRPMATITAPEEHTRQRRIVGRAFSDRALKEHEYILQRYSDMLIERLKDETKAGCTVDITDWFNFTTIDIISDLCFGDSFHSLKAGKYHPWLEVVFTGVKVAQLMTTFTLFPPFEDLVSAITPPFLKELLRKPQLKHFRYTQDRITQRMAADARRADVMQIILDNNDEKKDMSRAEIDATVNVLIVAGSETSAAAMSATMWFVLKNKAVLNRLVKEIRESFEAAEDINVARASKLPYLHAVLQEALRLHPAVPVSIPRYVDRPVEVGVWQVPLGARIGVPHSSCSRMPWNFVDAEAFVPERWLPEGEEKYKHDRKSASEPFLVGPRNCVGKSLAWAEMKLTLSKLLWHFDAELSGHNVLDWADQRVFLIHEKHPLNIGLRQRGLP